MVSQKNKNCFLTSADKKWPQDRRDRSDRDPRGGRQLIEILMELSDENKCHQNGIYPKIGIFR